MAEQTTRELFDELLEREGAALRALGLRPPRPHLRLAAAVELDDPLLDRLRKAVDGLVGPEPPRRPPLSVIRGGAE